MDHVLAVDESTSDGTRAQRPSRVLVVDSHEACRKAVAEAIERTGNGLTVVAETESGPVAVDVAGRATPDAILIGVEDGLTSALIQELKRSAPGAGILVVSSREDGEALVGAVQAGAMGFVPKSVAPDDIVEALHAVARGDAAIHPSVTGAGVLWAAERLRDAAVAGARFWGLTAREREILALLADGLKAREIAERLVVSRRTVERHLANAYRKLGAHSRIEAVREYLKLAHSAS